MDLKFSRIQFTPDLMPSDITGTEVIEENRATGAREFRFVKGPVFANIILADEINRTPPKTQSALLQAMQEYEVTAAGETHNLKKPFFVLATQNPIEQEGTYPLPEAQLDRFMFNIYVDYPSEADENEIVRTTTSAYEAGAGVVMKAEEILELQNLVRRVPVRCPAGPFHPAGGGLPRLYQELGKLGRRPEGVAVHDPGSQDPRYPAWQADTVNRRYPRGGPPGDAAPHRDLLLRRGRGGRHAGGGGQAGRGRGGVADCGCLNEKINRSVGS
jgi:hypothetical protein